MDLFLIRKEAAVRRELWQLAIAGSQHQQRPGMPVTERGKLAHRYAVQLGGDRAEAVLAEKLPKHCGKILWSTHRLSQHQRQLLHGREADVVELPQLLRPLIRKFPHLCQPLKALPSFDLLQKRIECQDLFPGIGGLLQPCLQAEQRPLPPPPASRSKPEAAFCFPHPIPCHSRPDAW